MIEKATHLGNRLYATNVDGIIRLETRRETEIHSIYLEPEVFEQLLQFAIKIGWLEKGKEIQ